MSNNINSEYNDDYRAGYVGVVGLPNSGKSTLVNALVGEKISIVTSKAQTTRSRIQGILTRDEAQYIFVDAPGVVKAESGLNKFLQEESDEIRDKADVLMVLLQVDCDKEKKIERVIEWAAQTKRPWIAVISKMDLILEHRAVLIERKLEKHNVPVIRLSALRLKEENREELFATLGQMLPKSPQPLYDPELFTTQNMRHLASEIVREKCFEMVKEEIPYGLAVQIRKFDESGAIPQVHADIILAKENHKSIVIGKGAQLIKDIGSLARKDLQEVMGQKVFLKLHVSVKKKWTENNSFMKEMGYVTQH